MKVDQEREEQLERLVSHTLQDQPLRRAPDALERRVLAQLESGAAVAGWRRGFAHWPLAARVAFILASVGIVKLALSFAMWLATPLDSPAMSVQLPSQIAWLQTLFVAIGSVVRTVPSVWVHAGLALLAIMYAALFGIGASAYRMVRAAH